MVRHWSGVSRPFRTAQPWESSSAVICGQSRVSAWAAGFGTENWVDLRAVIFIATNFAVRPSARHPISDYLPVIASEAKQSRFLRGTLDCFVARGPRNDGGGAAHPRTGSVTTS